MLVKVLFFGATAETAGRRQLDFEIKGGENAAAILERILDEFPALATRKLHISLNQQYAGVGEMLHDGDELAIFTAVSGG